MLGGSPSSPLLPGPSSPPPRPPLGCGLCLPACGPRPERTLCFSSRKHPALCTVLGPPALFPSTPPPGLSPPVACFPQSPVRGSVPPHNATCRCFCHQVKGSRSSLESPRCQAHKAAHQHSGMAGWVCERGGMWQRPPSTQSDENPGVLDGPASHPVLGSVSPQGFCPQSSLGSQPGLLMQPRGLVLELCPHSLDPGALKSVLCRKNLLCCWGLGAAGSQRQAVRPARSRDECRLTRRRPGWQHSWSSWPHTCPGFWVPLGSLG